MAIRVSNISGQALMRSGVFVRSIQHDLAFQEETAKRGLRVYNLTMQALIPAALLINRNVEQDLGLQEDIFEFNAIADRQVPSNVLEFQQEAFAASNPSVTDVLEFAQHARSSLINQNLIQYLGIGQGVGYCFGMPWAPFEVLDILDFEDVAGKGRDLEAENTITFGQSAEPRNYPDTQVLEFVQTVSVGKGKSASNTITFNQAIETESDFGRSVLHNNFIQHALTYYIDSSCNRKSYARFVGEGSDAGIGEQRLVYNASFILESISQGTTVVLRSPETDDRDRISFNRINRETRGGELNIYGDPVWAKVNTLLFTIVALSDGKGNCPDKITELMDFIYANLGQEIMLHDHTGTTWRGVITTPEETATEDRDGWWTVTFEFEGVAQPGEVPGHVFSISQNVGRGGSEWVRTATQVLGLAQAQRAGGSIYAEASSTIGLTQTLSGTQEVTILEEDFTAGVTSVGLHGSSPDTGDDTWSAHENYLDDGSMSESVEAGAYYPFSPVTGTRYQLTFDEATIITPSNSDNCIFGFFEGVTPSNIMEGDTVDGTMGDTTSKAVHCMREIDDDTNHAFRRGNGFEGDADTQQWTDASLRESANANLDLRILLDTTSSTWTATWYAKESASGSYTAVSPELPLLSNDIGAVGFSNDTDNTELSLDGIQLLELRPV